MAADREVAHNLVMLRNAVHEKSKYVRVVEHPDAAVVLIEIEKYQVTPGSDDRVHHDFRGRVRLNGEWERFHAAAEPSTAEIDIALARVIEELIFIPAELRKARQSA